MSRHPSDLPHVSIPDGESYVTYERLLEYMTQARETSDYAHAKLNDDLCAQIGRLGARMDQHEQYHRQILESAIEAGKATARAAKSNIVAGFGIAIAAASLIIQHIHFH